MLGTESVASSKEYTTGNAKLRWVQILCSKPWKQLLKLRTEVGTIISSLISLPQFTWGDFSYISMHPLYSEALVAQAGNANAKNSNPWFIASNFFSGLIPAHKLPYINATNFLHSQRSPNEKVLNCSGTSTDLGTSPLREHKLLRLYFLCLFSLVKGPPLL